MFFFLDHTEPLLSRCALTRGGLGDGTVRAHAMSQRVTWPAAFFRGTAHSDANPLLKSR